MESPRKGSPIALLMQTASVSSIDQLTGKDIDTVDGGDGYLAIKAYWIHSYLVDLIYSTDPLFFEGHSYLKQWNNKTNHKSNSQLKKWEEIAKS